MDKIMMCKTPDIEPGEVGESMQSSTSYCNKNGVETRKTINLKRKVCHGKCEEVMTEEYCYPNGEKDIIKTTKSGGKIECKKVHCKKG
jgi:hypothetical protein